MTSRALMLPEEIYLHYKILLDCGTKESFLKQIWSPKIGPIARLKAGDSLIFHQALDVLEKWGEWDQLLRLCREALSLRNADSELVFTAHDCKTWRIFLAAAARAADPEA